MLKTNMTTEKQSCPAPQYSGSGRLIVPPTCLNPNMLAASKSKYDYQKVVLKPEADKPLPALRNFKKNNTEKKSYPLEPADYIEIYCGAPKKWYSATVLEMLSESTMYVCYDDGTFSIEKTNEIEFKHISKQPATDDLSFEDNHHRYFIPKGLCQVIKNSLLKASEQDPSYDHVNDNSATTKKRKPLAQKEHDELDM